MQSSVSDFAARVLKFSDEEREQLVRLMRDAGEEVGFLDA
jgi:hypothetical protein